VGEGGGRVLAVLVALWGRRGRFQQIEENATAMQDVQLISEGFCPFPRLSCGVAIVSDQKLEAQSLRQIDAKTLSTLSRQLLACGGLECASSYV
jgi:hypothetical protein